MEDIYTMYSSDNDHDSFFFFFEQICFCHKQILLCMDKIIHFVLKAALIEWSLFLWNTMI